MAALGLVLDVGDTVFIAVGVALAALVFFLGVKYWRQIRTFIQEVVDEIRKVSWPDREQLKESTVVIVAFVAIVALLIFLMDQGVRGALALVQSLFGG